MFYGKFILAKKGPLAKIWIAAHMHQKLSRDNVLETNVNEAVHEVMVPKVRLSLRTNGHLLLGIVRIWALKAKYLLGDLNHARKIFSDIRFKDSGRKERVRARQAARAAGAGGGAAAAPNEATIDELEEEVCCFASAFLL